MNNIKNYFKNNKFFYCTAKFILDIIREFKYSLYRLLLIVLRVFKIKNNRILIVSYNGKGFGDNCKYVAIELLNNKDDYELYWATSDLNEQFPEGINTVKYKSLKYYYILVTSKIWLDNTRKPIYIIKRKNQVYFQFWHGCLPIKKIEFDAKDTLPKVYLRGSKNDNDMINFLVSNSKYCSNILYKKALGYNKEILEYGSPREDILFNKNPNIINQVHRYFNINKNQKIILYAPTFRNNYSGQYNIDFKILLSELEKQTKNEWLVLLRLHPNVVSDIEKYNFYFDNKIINASNYNDIQELIISSDLIITDYSSLMFDALLANIPTILYASDYSDYKKERGFYFDLCKLPFPLFTNNEQLTSFKYTELLSNMQNTYLIFKEKIGFFEGGNSSKKVSNKIREVINDDIKKQKY